MEISLRAPYDLFNKNYFRMKKNTPSKEKKSVPTPDEIWAILKETAAMQKENDRMIKENDRMTKETKREIKDLAALQKESKREMKESFAETKRRMEESSASVDRKFKNIFKEVGGIANSNGEFAEEYFENAFEADKTFAGMHFDAMKTNLRVSNPKIGREDEYDIVLYNNKNVAIIESKYKARESNIEDVIQKADSFRFWFPHYKKHKIYLGLAGLTIENGMIRKARKHGIAVIRQSGNKVIVNDKNLKVYWFND